MTNSNVLKNFDYDSHKSRELIFLSQKPVEFFRSESDVPVLTITKFDSQKIIKKEFADSYRKNIQNRMKYLVENLDEDQDAEIFSLSKSTVKKFLEYVKQTEPPLISVDNSGYIVFEWRQYHQYDIVMLLFMTNNRISLTGIKEEKCLLKATGVVQEISNIFLQL